MTNIPAEKQFDYPSHWLKEQIALTKAQLRRCERAMELIQNKNSLYSQGHWVMVTAHTKALAVYEAELNALTRRD